MLLTIFLAIVFCAAMAMMLISCVAFIQDNKFFGSAPKEAREVIIQFKAFAKGLTPYPKKAKWFCVPIGAVPALLLAVIIGPNTALGAGIGTMFLSFGNAFMFGGLLATMPSAEQFTAFESSLHQPSEG